MIYRIEDNCIVDSDGYVVAEVWDNGNRKKKLALLSAAPDLLKALRKMTDELEYQYDSANSEGGKTEKMRIRLVKQARAAIAKAEGKTSKD